MEGTHVQGNLIGYYHFSSKDKSQQYFIVQIMFTKAEPEKNNMRATVVGIFINEEIYKGILQKNIGDKIDVEIVPNLETGKISYKVLI